MLCKIIERKIKINNVYALVVLWGIVKSYKNAHIISLERNRWLQNHLSFKMQYTINLKVVKCKFQFIVT